MASPLLFALLVALAVMLGFIAAWQILRQRDPVDQRLKELGLEEQADGTAEGDGGRGKKKRSWSTITRLLAGLGFGPRLADALTLADVSATAAEFAVVMMSAGVVGFAIGFLRGGVLAGLLVGAMATVAPYFFLRSRGRRRQRAFTEQLPDVLTMLVGTLRAGYGMSQAIEMLVQELPPPASVEFARVMRGVSLGLQMQDALEAMSERMDSDDLAMVVTAINVQHEMGGNLAQTLDTIGETIRDRLRILREIRVMTAQQRLTGYFLAVWPAAIAFLLFLLNPRYIGRLFAPDMRLIPAVAVVMQVVGFLIIRKIVDIEV